MKVTDLIVAKSDIPEYLTQKGVYCKREPSSGNYRAVCLVHGGTREDSLSISRDGQKCYCFACGFGGTIIELYMELEQVDFHEAVAKLAEMYNIPLEHDAEYQNRKTEIEKNQNMAAKYHRDLPAVVDYLTKKRGLTAATIDNFNLGHLDGGVVIPIRDVNGQTVAFAKRNFETGKAKYINSKNSEYFEKGSTLYNMDRAKKMMRKQNRLFLCEGYFDVMSADEQSLPVAGYIGATITKDQINLIQKLLNDTKSSFTIYFAPDNDEEGQKRVPQIRDKFRQYAPKMNVRIVKMPDSCKDFNDCHVKGYQIDGLETEHIDLFVAKKLLSECADPETEYSVIAEYVKTVPNPMVRGDIARLLAERWKRPEDAKNILQWLNGAADPDSLLQEFKLPDQAVSDLKELLKHGILKLGFPLIDAALKGMRLTEVLILAAYAGVGKTWMAIAIALHLATRENRRVIFFSMEMSAASLYSRLIAMFLGKEVDEVEELILKDDNLVLQVKTALEKRLYVVDTNNLSVKDIQERITFANTRIFDKPCDAIIVDYLQYMKHKESGYEGISETIRQFKPLAKENNIMPVVLCQLNRTGNQFAKPSLQMLKGSGDIEASGDTIIGLYAPGENPQLSMDEQNRLKDAIYATVMKHRRGAKAFDFEMELDPTTTRFIEKSNNLTP